MKLFEQIFALSKSIKNIFQNESPPDHEYQFECDPEGSYEITISGDKFKTLNIEKLIKNFENLETLIIKDTSFEEIPDRLEEIKTLTKLEFYSNPKATDVSNISKLTSLKRLVIKDNKCLKALPDNTVFPRDLNYLDLSGNSL